jgi:hypothetical protein
MKRIMSAAVSAAALGAAACGGSAPPSAACRHLAHQASVSDQRANADVRRANDNSSSGVGFYANLGAMGPAGRQLQHSVAVLEHMKHIGCPSNMPITGFGGWNQK